MNRNKEEESTPGDVKPAEGSSAALASDGPQAAAEPVVRKRLEEATAEEVARAIFRAADREVKPNLSS